MPFRRDMARTLNHPKIREFLLVCDTLGSGPAITAGDLRDPRLLVLVDSIFILRWDEPKSDFIYHYWGSSVASAYGTELTGQHLRTGHPHAFTENFIEAHYESMKQEKRVFAGGNLDWLDKDYRTWDQVTLPLKRDGQIRETLTYIQFNIEEISL